MGLPPVELGALNEMLSWAFPTVAVPIVGAPGVVATTPKLWVTIGAARKVALPPWFAAIVQVPVATIVTLPLATVQTNGDWELKVIGNPDEATADSAISDELNVCEPGFVKLMVWLAWPAVVNVKFCVTDVPLLAVKTSGNVPIDEGVPCNKPVPTVNVTPVGKVPEVRDSVGAGVPVAATVKLFEDVVEKVAALALVKSGALLRLSVRLAVIGASVGTVVAPQVPSASTAAIDTLLRLMTYEALVALD